LRGRAACTGARLARPQRWFGPERAAAYHARVTNDCLFCRIVAGEVPATVVRETPTTLAFRDIRPKAPVHVLVMPKEHYADIATLVQNDPELASAVLTTAADVAASEGLLGEGFRLIFNTGEYAGQEVAHVHAHVLGGAPLGPMLAR
jgi:histidine triad (HIT) family protein